MFLPRMCGRFTSRAPWVPAVVLLAFVFQASARVLPAQGWRALGPFGGPAEVISASAAAPGFLVAGSRQALLFHSTDGGDSWLPVAFPPRQNATLHAIWIDPSSRDRWLIGVTPERGTAGLYRTVDAGRSWHAIEAFAGRAVWSIASTPGDPKTIAAGAGDGVWLSPDGGSAWKRISPQDNAELQPVVALAIHPKDARTVLAGTTHLPWRTGDGGSSWDSVHDGMLDDSDVFSIAIDRTDPDRVWSSACSGMYRSADGGRTWTKLMGSADASFRTYAIAQDPREPNRVFAGTSDGLLRSIDGGTTWKKLRPGLFKAIAFDALRAGRLYAAGGAGLLRSDDAGDTFQTIHRGYAARQLTQWIPSIAKFTVYDALDRSAPWSSGDGGETWQRPVAQPLTRAPRRRPAKGKGKSARKQATRPVAQRLGLALLSSVARKDPAKIVVAGDGFIAASTDGGTTLTPLASPGGSVTAVLARADAMWAATPKGLFRKLWTAPNSWTAVPVPSLAGETIRILADLDESIAAASHARAAVSANSGKDWTPLSSAAPSAEFYAFARTGRFFLAATSHGLFRSQDSGRSWTRAAEPGSDTVHQVLVHPTRPGVAFAAQFGNVWTSADSGLTWRRVAQPGLEQTAVHSLAVLAARPERLYALTGAHGVFVTEWEK